MAKFKTLSFCQKVFLWYQDVSVQAVEQVEFPIYALPMHH